MGETRALEAAAKALVWQDTPHVERTMNDPIMRKRYLERAEAAVAAYLDALLEDLPKNEAIHEASRAAGPNPTALDIIRGFLRSLRQGAG